MKIKYLSLIIGFIGLFLIAGCVPPEFVLPESGWEHINTVHKSDTSIFFANTKFINRLTENTIGFWLVDVKRPRQKKIFKKDEKIEYENLLQLYNVPSEMQQQAPKVFKKFKRLSMYVEYDFDACKMRIQKLDFNDGYRLIGNGLWQDYCNDTSDVFNLTAKFIKERIN